MHLLLNLKTIQPPPVTVIPEKTNSEEKPAPMTPPVSEMASSDIPKTNKVDGLAKLAPSVNETAPPEDISVLTNAPTAVPATTPVQPKKPYRPCDVFDACRTNNVASLHSLLSRFGADAIIKANNTGWTGLHYAAHYGHLPIVELLLESGAEIDITNDYYRETPFMQAAASGNVDVMRRLLEAGADLEIKNRFNRTPLSMALLENHTGTAFLLTPMPVVTPTPAVTSTSGMTSTPTVMSTSVVTIPIPSITPDQQREQILQLALSHRDGLMPYENLTPE
jgi:hypothetical protein